MRTFEIAEHTITEYAPARRTIFIERINRVYPWRVVSYHLPFPYVIFVQNQCNSNNNLRVGFRTEPLNPNTFARQHIKLPCLPNINYDYSVCFGRSNPSIANFWRTSFQNDEWPGTYSLRINLGLSYDRWADFSVPEFLKLYKQHGPFSRITIGQAIKLPNAH